MITKRALRQLLEARVNERGDSRNPGYVADPWQRQVAGRNDWLTNAVPPSLARRTASGSWSR